MQADGSQELQITRNDGISVIGQTKNRARMGCCGFQNGEADAAFGAAHVIFDRRSAVAPKLASIVPRSERQMRFLISTFLTLIGS